MAASRPPGAGDRLRSNARFGRVAALTSLAIAGIVTALYLVAAVLTIALGLPWDLDLPWPVRAAGVALVVGGVAMVAWLFRYRRPEDVVRSTHATLRKLVSREALVAPLGRTEPLVVVGPYRLVRHPLYSGVVLLAFGIGSAVARTGALLGALFLFLWFALVIAPFEERELRALFGPAYEAYARRTPRFVPLPRRRGRSP